ncbi:MAG: response regulator [Gammaproteobacteria bacterium]|nr:response regulator [Gammaproteobacteria bacterium]
MSELRRILYVEDEPDIRAVTKVALEKIGNFEVKICASGQEALECAQAFSPDLFLLDVMMPGMDGPETLTALREISQLKEIPAMFMTAKIQVQEVEELKTMGVIDVISKPFDVLKLSEQLRESWDRYFKESKSV